MVVPWPSKPLQSWSSWNFIPNFVLSPYPLEQSLQQITSDIDDITYTVHPWTGVSIARSLTATVSKTSMIFLSGFSLAKRLESRSVQVLFNRNHICKKILRPAFYKQATIRLPNCTRVPHTSPCTSTSSSTHLGSVGNKECVRAVRLPTGSTHLPPRNSSNILSGIARPVHEDHPFDWLATKVHSTRQTVLVLLPRCQWHQAKYQKLICLIPRRELYSHSTGNLVFNVPQSYVCHVLLDLFHGWAVPPLAHSGSENRSIARLILHSLRVNASTQAVQRNTLQPDPPRSVQIIMRRLKKSAAETCWNLPVIVGITEWKLLEAGKQHCLLSVFIVQAWSISCPCTACLQRTEMNSLNAPHYHPTTANWNLHPQLNFSQESKLNINPFPVFMCTFSVLNISMFSSYSWLLASLDRVSGWGPHFPSWRIASWTFRNAYQNSSNDHQMFTASDWVSTSQPTFRLQKLMVLLISQTMQNQQLAKVRWDMMWRMLGCWGWKNPSSLANQKKSCN